MFFFPYEISLTNEEDIKSFLEQFNKIFSYRKNFNKRHKTFLIFITKTINDNEILDKYTNQIEEINIKNIDTKSKEYYDLTYSKVEPHLITPYKWNIYGYIDDNYELIDQIKVTLKEQEFCYKN